LHLHFSLIGSRRSSPYYSEEDEEEFELTPFEREKFNIPHHEKKVNKGLLRKYGVPEHEMKSLKSSGYGNYL